MYSVLMDGSTDKGRIWNELFVIIFCKKDDTLQEVFTCARYLCVLEPERADADGLIECFGRALMSMRVENVLERANVLDAHGFPVLVGCGTDGAAVNVLAKLVCEASFRLFCHGCIGPGAIPTDLNWHVRIPFPVVFFVT